MPDPSTMQVVMCEATSHVPPEILQAAQRHVEEMARELATVDRQSSFWASMRESGLSVEVLGWKFRFNIEGEALVLSEVNAVPPQIA